MKRLSAVRTLFAATPGTRPAAVNGLINGVSVAAPLVIGLAFGEATLGAIGCLGAYVAAFTNKGGPRRSRTLGLVTAAVANAVAFILGAFTSHVALVAIVLLTALVFVAAMGSAVGPTVARLGTMPATAFLASSVTDGKDARGVLLAGGVVLAGGVWYAVATAVLTPGPRVTQILRSVAEPYGLLARNLAARASGEPEPADHAYVVAAVRRAEAAVVGVASPGGNETLAAQLTVLVQRAEATADLCVALGDLGPADDAIAPAVLRTLADVAGQLDSVAVRLSRRRRGRPAGPSTGLDDLTERCDALRSAVLTDGEPYSRVLAAARQRRTLEAMTTASASAADHAEALVAARNQQVMTPNGARPALVDISRLQAAITLSNTEYRHALRITAITAGFFAVVAGFDLPHGEWGILAVLRVLQPQYGATVQRAGQRIIGNVVGGACAAVLIASVSNSAVLAAILFVVITAGFTLRPVNYAFWVVFGTPLVLLIGDIADPGDWGAAVARIVMTIVGSAVALVGGYVLWPSWERDRLAAGADAAVAATEKYLAASMQSLTDPETEVVGPRRAAETALAGARATSRLARREPGDAATTQRSEALLDSLYLLQKQLAALSVLATSKSVQLPALDEYSVSASRTLTAADDRAALLDRQRRALDAMYDHLDQLYTRRLDELSADSPRDTPVRAAIHETEPLVRQLAAVTRALDQAAGCGGHQGRKS